VVVTGGSRGIGKAIALHSRREGAQTVLGHFATKISMLRRKRIGNSGPTPITFAGDMKKLGRLRGAAWLRQGQALGKATAGEQLPARPAAATSELHDEAFSRGLRC